MATPNLYEKLENAALAALAPIIGAIDKVVFPDDNSEAQKPFARPRITVAYHSFDTSEQVSISNSGNAKVHNLQIMFEGKKKHGPLGIFDLEIQAEAVLNGLRVSGFKPFIIGNFTYANHDILTGVWTYNLIIKTEGVGIAPQTYEPKYFAPGQ